MTNITPADTVVFFSKNNKSKYPLRTKFASKLKGVGLAEDAMDNAIDIALGMTNEELLNSLWEMSFPESQLRALNRFGITTDDDKSNKDGKTCIPSDFVPFLRNELRFQYTRIYPSFLAIPDVKYANSFKQFLKKMAMDKVLSAGIFEKVFDFLSRNFSTDHSFVEKTIYLLKSDRENYRYGGLINIGFRTEEAKSLLDKAPDIASLVENISKVMEESLPQHLTSGAYQNLPFKGLDEMLKAKGIEVIDPSTAVAIPTEESSKPPEKDVHNNISLREILENLELFNRFTRVANEVISAGFSPEAVLAKMEGIQKILDGVTALG